MAASTWFDVHLPSLIRDPIIGKDPKRTPATVSLDDFQGPEKNTKKSRDGRRTHSSRNWRLRALWSPLRDTSFSGYTPYIYVPKIK
jgi:hypothetical protein